MANSALASEAINTNAPIPTCPVGSSGPLASTSTFAFPEVGRDNEVEIGQGVISTSQGDILIGTISLKEDVSISGNYFTDFTVQLPAGLYSPTFGKNGWEYLISESIFRYGSAQPRHGGAKPNTFIFYDQYAGNFKARVYVGLTNITVELPNSEVFTKKCMSISNKGFRSELLYTGISKGTASFEYREFINDLARPAFSQQLHYDLADGNEIGYKGARIIILKATNVSLRYKVIKPMD